MSKFMTNQLVVSLLLALSISSLPAQQVDTAVAHKIWLAGCEALRLGHFQDCERDFIRAAEIFDSGSYLSRALDCHLNRAELLSRSALIKESNDLLDTIDILREDLSSQQQRHQYHLATLCLRVENEVDFEARRQLLDAAKRIHNQLDNIGNQLNAQLNHLWGLHFFDLEVLDSAAIFLEHALPQAIAAEDSYLVGRITLQWAKVLRRLGDHAKAIDLIRQGIASYQDYHGPVHTVIATGYNDLAINQKQLGQVAAAGESFAKALSIRAKLHGKHSNAYARVLNNAALQFLEAGDLKTALLHARETVRIFEMLPKPDKRFHLASHNTLAKVLSAMGQYDKAAIEYRKALAMHRSSYPGSSRARYYLISLGNNALDRHQPLEALQHFHQAMCIAIDGLDVNDLHSNPSMDDPSNYQSLKTLCLLKARAWHTLHRHTGDTMQLKSAIELYRLADHFAAKNRTESHYQKSRLAYSRQNLGLYQGAIESALDMYQLTGKEKYLNQAFLYREKSKSLTLLEDLLEANALRTSGVPEEYLAREHTIQDSIAKLRRALIKATSEGDTSLMAQLRQERISLQIEFDAFKKNLEVKFPRFFQSKYNFDFHGLSDMQQLLGQNEVAVSYFVGRDKIFRFLIKRDTADARIITKPDSLNQWVEQLRRSILAYDPALSPDDVMAAQNLLEYKRMAYLLFDLLLGDLIEQLVTKVVIIPDDVLNYIPFGALLTSQDLGQHRLAELPFLERKYTLSYNYSSTLAKQMGAQKPEKAPRILAIAPSFHGITRDSLRATLAPLLFNEREAERITGIWPGQTLKGREATRSSFQQANAAYGIIHFATHALVNEGNADLSYLAFAAEQADPSYLYLQELYSMDLPVHLVTLSACETSLGPLQQGEGIASLAQGFSYAGAKSIITSLWEVEDGAAEQIMVSFYQNLASKSSKDEALKAAKIDYLETVDDAFAHPFYWAAFVPIGDMSALDKPSEGFAWWWYILVIAIVLLLLFFNRTKIRSTNAQDQSTL